MNNQYLDHVIWACSDLEHGTRAFESLTGVRAQYGGRHASGLTHNALVGLGGRCYLEILAPTGAPGPGDDEWARFAHAAPVPRLLTYCMRSPLPLGELAQLAATLDFRSGEVGDNGRTTPEGVALRWQWLAPKQSSKPGSFDRAFPFFIDWLDSPHPAESFAALQPYAGIRLRQFAIGHPEAQSLSALLTRLRSPVDTYLAAELEFRVRLETPRGLVEL